MKSEIINLPFSELLSNIVDNRGRSCPTESSGMALIATNCIKNDALYPAFDKVRYVSDETYKSWFRGHPTPGDLIFVCKGSPGTVCMTPDSVNFCIAQDMVAVRAKESLVKPKYLLALLRSEKVQRQISNMHVGTLIPHFKKGDFKNLNLDLHSDIEVQERIGSVYYEFCNNIELNRRTNETLEAMAQALFRSWFVDFDPVIDNALAAGNDIPEPLKARAAARQALGDARKPLPEEIRVESPDEFEFRDEMGWVPQGWESGSILEHAELISGGTPKTSIDDYWNGEIPWASAKDVSQCHGAFLIATEKRITETGLAQSSTRLVDPFSTVLVARGATTGRLTLFGSEMAMNQTCYALRSTSDSPFYLYCFMSSEISAFTASAHGSIFDTITTATFKSTRVLLPPPSIEKVFHGRVEGIFGKILLNLRYNERLQQIRDTLLPKLLSGELTIPAAEKLAADVL